MKLYVSTFRIPEYSPDPMRPEWYDTREIYINVMATPGNNPIRCLLRHSEYLHETIQKAEYYAPHPGGWMVSTELVTLDNGENIVNLWQGIIAGQSDDIDGSCRFTFVPNRVDALQISHNQAEASMIYCLMQRLYGTDRLEELRQKMKCKG